LTVLSQICVVAALLGAFSSSTEEHFDAFGYRWTVPTASDWQLEQKDATPVLHLLRARGPLPGPRRPIQFALAETPEFSRVSVELDARPLGHSLLVVFAYRDHEHFDYAHLSIDPATKEPHHNGVFHVYGGERVRISGEAGSAAFAAPNRWYHVQLIHDGSSGDVRVKVNGEPIQALHAADLSLSGGRVGIGSFDETGYFKNVQIHGVAVP